MAAAGDAASARATSLTAMLTAILMAPFFRAPPPSEGNPPFHQSGVSGVTAA